MEIGPQFEVMKAVSDAWSQAIATPDGVDWNHRESVAYHFLLDRCPHVESRVSRDAMFLGGDRLRHYLTLQLDNHVVIASNIAKGLRVPALLDEMRSEKFGTVRLFSSSKLSYTCAMSWLAATPQLVNRLDVPKVYLASLTNSSRYQTRRYPLNVGRLAQWVRFQHVGRAKAVDLALSFAGDLQSLCEDLIAYKPDILGISLNFGEMDTLRLFIGAIRKSALRPIICLGNVLAAWVPEDVMRICPRISNVGITFLWRGRPGACLPNERCPIAGRAYNRTSGHQHRAKCGRRVSLNDRSSR